MTLEPDGYTVKHIISGVSKFGDLKKTTYWHMLTLRSCTTMAPDNKEDLM